MRIGITGGRGVLGNLASGRLRERGNEVLFFAGDVCDSVALSNWIFETPMDALIHFAAIVPIKAVTTSPGLAFKVNVGGTINLLEAVAASKQRPWLLFASSSHVYGPSTAPLDENSPICPQNIYGETKRMAEDCVIMLGDQIGLPWCVARIFSFYHRSQTGDFLYPTLRRRFLEEDLSKPFALKGVNDVRDISNAESIVEKIISITERHLEGIYNIGSGKGIKIGDFARSISPKPLEFLKESQTKTTSLVADISKLKLALKASGESRDDTHF